jgi:hypothetical protein
LKEGWKAILVGDVIDNGVSAGSKHLGLEFQNPLTPMEQIELAYSLFEPLTRRDQLIGIVGGNHSERTMKAVGNHPEKILAMLLSKAPYGAKGHGLTQLVITYRRLVETGRWDKPSQQAELEDTLKERFEEIQGGEAINQKVKFWPGIGTFQVGGVGAVSHHGNHTRSRENWNRLERAARGYQLYLTAHNHILSSEVGREDIQGKSNLAWFVSAGTYQGYESYAEIAMYPPRVTGSVLVSISGGQVKGVEYLI